MTRKKLVLIPFWIHDSLKRNPTATLATALDFPALRQIVALGDIVGMLTLQMFGKQIFGDQVDGDLWMTWMRSIPDDQKATSDFFSKTVSPLSDDASYKREVEGRLFTPESRNDQHKEPFICYDLTPDVCGVVIYPGFFTGGANTHELQLTFVREVLKVLYVYDTQSEVAKTSLFKRYLELLGTA